MSIPVVLVGAGNACRLWLPVVARMPDAELRALVDVDTGKAEAILREHGVEARVEADVGEAARSHAPCVVVDLTPPFNRRVVAEASFAAGCDLIAEKPLAESVAAARELVDMAETAGRRMAVMQNHRFHPALRALREAIADGTVGRAVEVECELRRCVEAFDRVAEMDSPLLADMAIHAFDGARALLGTDPVRVLAHETLVPESGFRGGPSAQAVFEFEGGATFTYRGSWAAAGLETPWFGDWRVDGTAAALRWRDDGAVVGERFAEHTPVGPRFEPLEVSVSDGPNDHPAAVPALLRQMTSGHALETPAADNLRSLAMVFAAIESARTGGWVPVDS